MPPRLSDVPTRVRSGALSYLSLFTSLGTLLCCALPSLLVLFGLGATVASVLSGSPVAGHHVASQALGVHRGRRPDLQQFRLRLCSCAEGEPALLNLCLAPSRLE